MELIAPLYHEWTCNFPQTEYLLGTFFTLSMVMALQLYKYKILSLQVEWHIQPLYLSRSTTSLSL